MPALSSAAPRRVEPVAALGRLERRRVPLGVVVLGLDVVVGVEQHGRRARRARPCARSPPGAPAVGADDLDPVEALGRGTGPATASALRCTSPARAGSALTDSIRTRSSRSFRMPGSTASTFARISSLMEVNLDRPNRGPADSPYETVRQLTTASGTIPTAAAETGRRARRWRGSGRRTRPRSRRARRWRGRSRCRRRSRRRRAGCRGCAGRPRRPGRRRTAGPGPRPTSRAHARRGRARKCLVSSLRSAARALVAGECLRDGGRVGRAQAGGHASTLVDSDSPRRLGCCRSRNPTQTSRTIGSLPSRRGGGRQRRRGRGARRAPRW